MSCKTHVYHCFFSTFTSFLSNHSQTLGKGFQNYINRHTGHLNMNDQTVNEETALHPITLMPLMMF